MAGLLVFLILVIIELSCAVILLEIAVFKVKRNVSFYQKDLLTWQMTMTKRYIRIERVLFPNIEITFSSDGVEK